MKSDENPFFCQIYAIFREKLIHDVININIIFFWKVWIFFLFLYSPFKTSNLPENISVNWSVCWDTCKYIISVISACAS